MKNNFIKSNKLISIIIVLFLGLCMFVAFSFAIFKTNTLPITNTFTVAEVTSEIEEENKIVDGDVNKSPKVHNLGNTDAIVRMRVTISPNNLINILSEKQDSEYTDPYLWIDNNVWHLEADGYYYYQGILSPGAYTPVLFDNVYNVTETIDGKTVFKAELENLEITIYQETVQSIIKGTDGKKIDAFEGGTFNYDNAKLIWQYFDNNE